jgi:hypothetical protein
MIELNTEEIAVVNGAGFWKDVGSFMHTYYNEVTCGVIPDSVYDRGRAAL